MDDFSGTCLYEGKVYQEGDRWKDSESCNWCWCHEGFAECTEMLCIRKPEGWARLKARLEQRVTPTGLSIVNDYLGTCLVDGKVYHEGDRWKDREDCNWCHCWKGRVYCNQKLCRRKTHHKPHDTVEGHQAVLRQHRSPRLNMLDEYSHLKKVILKWSHGLPHTVLTKSKLTAQKMQITLFLLMPWKNSPGITLVKWAVFQNSSRVEPFWLHLFFQWRTKLFALFGVSTYFLWALRTDHAGNIINPHNFLNIELMYVMYVMTQCNIKFGGL